MAAASDGPPPSERQLRKRPSECPFCNGPIMDELHWTHDDRAVVDLACQNKDCDWNAHLELTVDEPGDD